MAAGVSLAMLCCRQIRMLLGRPVGLPNECSILTDIDYYIGRWQKPRSRCCGTAEWFVRQEYQAVVSDHDSGRRCSYLPFPVRVLG